MYCNRTRERLKYLPVQRHHLAHIGKKNLFHKLICVIIIFMRKFFVVQCHPQNIVTSNYFRIMVFLSWIMQNLNFDDAFNIILANDIKLYTYLNTVSPPLDVYI